MEHYRCGHSLDETGKPVSYLAAMIADHRSAMYGSGYPQTIYDCPCPACRAQAEARS